MLRVRVEADIHRADGADSTFSRWTGYAIEHDLRSVYPTVRLTAAGAAAAIDDLLEALEHNPTIRIRVDGTLVATCRVISDVATYSRRGGTVVSLVGSGVTQAAGVDAMPLDWRPETMTIAEAAADIMRPFRVDVVADATEAQIAVAQRRMARTSYESRAHQTEAGTWVPDEAVRRAVTVTRADDREVRPRVGETRLAYLRRMLAAHHLLCWETPEGKLFVGLPQPASAIPALTLDTGQRTAGEGRILEVSRTRRYGTQHTAIRVVGRGGRGGARTVDATVADEGLVARGWSALAIVEAPDLRGQVEAEKRAKLAMAGERLAAYEVQVRMAGHGLGAALAAVDRNLAVHAPEAGLRNVRLYCIQRRFEHSRVGGTVTNLTLVRKGVWEAEP